MSDKECGCSIKAGSFGYYLDRSCCEIDALTAQIQSLTEQLSQVRESLKQAFNDIDSERVRRVAAQEAITLKYIPDLAQITAERDQLREQCAYNQLQLEAMAAKLAKADRMDGQ